MTRVLVTGASGFIGSHIVEALTASGFLVRALVRRSSSLSFIGRAEPAFGDVTDFQSLRQALDGVQGVVHCAGLTKALSLEEYRRVNRDGTDNLLRACRAASPTPERIVVLSSLAAYGPSRNGQPKREDDERLPVSYYGRSKLEGQRAAESSMKDLSVSILIPPAVYGPRDRDIFVYFRFARIGIMPFLGRGERYLSVIYVKDLARAAVECLLRNEAAGAGYFVEDGEVRTWRGFASAIVRAAGRRPVAVCFPPFIGWGVALLADCCAGIARRPPLLGTQKMRELLQSAWTCTGERIRRQLGWHAIYTLDKGVEETYSWYVTNGWL